jgi:hypothetical protein
VIAVIALLRRAEALASGYTETEAAPSPPVAPPARRNARSALLGSFIALG